MARLKKFRVTYNAFPNAPDMRSELTVWAESEEQAIADFKQRGDVPPGSSIMEIKEI